MGTKRQTKHFRLSLMTMLLISTTLAALSLPSGTTLAAYDTNVQFISASSPTTAIACPTSTTCYVVSETGGAFEETGGESGTVTPLTIASDGTITSGATVLPSWVGAVESGRLSGIGCASPDACYVVGMFTIYRPILGEAHTNEGGVAPITNEDGNVIGSDIHWVDGTRILYDIACPSPTMCFAVGASSVQGRTVAINVNGDDANPGDWNRVAGSFQLTSIECPTTTTCYAVGYDSNFDGVYVALSTAAMDSANDVPIATAQVLDGTRQLFSIDCPTTIACYASGDDGSSGVLAAFAISGSSMTPTSLQVVPGTSELNSIACADASTCYAVGNVATGEDTSNAVVVQYALSNPVAQQILAIGDLSSIDCAGDACYAAGTNAITGQSVVTTIEPRASVTTALLLNSSDATSSYGQAVTVSATVGTGGAAGVPTGWVQFYIDGTSYGDPVPLVDNLGQIQAALALPTLPAGSHTIAGIYSGDTNFTGSTSDPLTQMVDKALLTIAADDQTVTAGDAIPALTWTPSGFVNGENASVISGAPSLSTAATAASPPGEYPIVIGPGNLAATNYTFAFASGATLTITNAAPTAAAGLDQTVAEGATVTLDGSNSSDPDGATLTYAWELISQTGPAITLSSDTAASPTFATTDNGSYTFQLTVSNGAGGTDSDEVSIVVGNVEPLATFDPPDSVAVGSPIPLALTDPTDPGAADTLAGFTYAFDCGAGFGTFGASNTASCPTSTSGTLTVKGKIRDKDGGESVFSKQVAVLADSTAPTGTISVNSGGAYTNSTSANLSLTCQDAVSGCSQMAFSTDGTTFSAPAAFATTAAFTLPVGDGIKTVSVRFTDGAGNLSTVVSDSIILDQTAPQTTIVSMNPATTPTNQTSISFNFAGSDSNGVGRLECSFDDGDFMTCASQHLYVALSDGPHTVLVRAVDGPGNVDPSPAIYSWTVDTVVPTVTIEQSSGQGDPTNSDSITFDVVFSEPVSGFDAADVVLGGTANPQTAVVAPATGTSSTYTVTVSGMTADGTVSASVRVGAASDAAGNLSTASTSTDNSVTVDRTAPVTTATISGPQGQNGWRLAATVTLATEAEVTTTYAINGGTPQPYTAPFALTPDGTYTITFASVDGLGNQEVMQSITVKVDGTAPDIEPLANQELDPASPAGAPVVFTPVVSDNLTPVDAIVVGCVDQGGILFESGQTVPIGTATTITCTAADQAGNTATTSFTATVASVADLFDGLGELIEETNTGSGQQRQLLVHAGLAEAFVSWSPQLSCLQLSNMDRYIRSQVARRRITTDDAALLYEQSGTIRAALGCGDPSG